MGKIAAGARSILRKGAYTDRFNRLEKKFERINLPASLVNMVSIEISFKLPKLSDVFKKEHEPPTFKQYSFLKKFDRS